MIKDCPVRVAVSGCNGRIGKNLIHSLRNVKNLVLTVVLCRKESKSTEKYINSLFKNKSSEIVVHYNIREVKDEFDVLIDFTNPEVSISYLKDCHLYRKNMVIGTTGFNRFQINKIWKLSHDIGIVLSENFSIGINSIFFSLEKLVNVMGNNIDVEIIEMHHAKKDRTPSGTSIKIKNIIQNSFLKGEPFLKKRRKENFKKKITKEVTRKNKKIVIHSIRAKNIFGEHSIFFFLEKERLEIKHQVYDINVFSHGAIRAAIWIQNQKKSGLFSMLDVLKN